MCEIYRASISPGNWKDYPLAPLLGWWWALFWINDLVAKFVFRMSLRAQELEQLINVASWQIFSDLWTVPSYLLAHKLVEIIHRAQNQSASGLASVAEPAVIGAPSEVAF